VLVLQLKSDALILNLRQKRIKFVTRRRKKMSVRSGLF